MAKAGSGKELLVKFYDDGVYTTLFAQADSTVTAAFGSANGQPVYAAAGGTVISASYHSSWGNNVLIDHGNGVWTRYAHLSSIGVSAGQTVSQGQYIGKVGSTGNSSGPHLHFEVYVNKNRVNPEPYIGL